MSVEYEPAAEIFLEANRQTLKKFYQDRENDWKAGVVGGCDAAASLAKARSGDIDEIGINFAETLLKAHTTGPKTVFDAQRAGKISDAELSRYLTTGLTADGGRWELLGGDSEAVGKDFGLQAQKTLDLLKGVNDAQLKEYEAELEKAYFPEPTHRSENLLVFDSKCSYPFMRGLRDDVNHQLQYDAEKKMLVYSYMGPKSGDSLGKTLLSYGNEHKHYGDAYTYVKIKDVDEARVPELIKALETGIAAQQKTENP